MNSSNLVGRLTKEIELRYTASNKAYVKFIIAVNRKYANADGERVADFISCIVWDKQAENMARYCYKGQLVSIEGRIQTGSYDDKDGKRVYTTDIVCDSVQYLERKQEENREEFARVEKVGRQSRGTGLGITEDDLPF